MIISLFIQITASLISSIVMGGFGKKVIGKNVKSIKAENIINLYSLYIAISAFVSTLMFSYLLSSVISIKWQQMTDIGIFNVLKICTINFSIILLIITVGTILILYFKGSEKTEEKGKRTLKSIKSTSKSTKPSENAVNKKNDIKKI